MDRREQGRYFISNGVWEEVTSESKLSDQRAGKAQPPLEKSFDGYELIPLLDWREVNLKERDIGSIVSARVSRRVFTDEEISMQALSYLLWATQGIKKTMPNNYATFRTVPSAGARHPFETYLYLRRVEGLKEGLYRYVASRHSLILLEEGDFSADLSEAALGQKFVGEGAATFVWSVIPYRTEWRYNLNSYKPILLDAGHVCQNLYLACEALGLGTCAVAAYSQKLIDLVFKLDGMEEFAIYLAPVGNY